MKNKKSHYHFDKDTGFWGVPYYSRALTSDVNIEPIMIKNDEYGCRTSDSSKKNHKDTIVTIGGSHSWGAGIEVEQRYSEVLSRNSKENVVNMGLNSLGIDQICIAIIKKSKKYNPKIIVIEQYPWAVLRIANNYVAGYIKPVFSLNSDKEIQFQKVPWFAKYRFIRAIIGNYRSYKKQLSEFQSGIDLSLSYDPMLDPMFLAWKVNHYAYLYELLEKILIVIKDYCHENNIKLLLILGTVHQQFSQVNYKNKSDLVNYNLPTEKIIDILDSLDIDYIDSTKEMLEQHSIDDPVIFEDGHINIKGHKIFANLIEGKLKQKKWL